MSPNVSKVSPAVQAVPGSTRSGHALPSQNPNNPTGRTGSEAVVVLIGGSISIQKLEKHLADYKKGKGYLSKRTGSELVDLHHRNGSALNEMGPVGARSYLSYSTAFSYDKKARFVNSVSKMAESSQRIRKNSK